MSRRRGPMRGGGDPREGGHGEARERAVMERPSDSKPLSEYPDAGR